MYDVLILDAVNIGYKVFFNEANKEAILKSKIKIGEKKLYKLFVSEYINTVEYLEKKFESSEVVLLFDNYTSREELQEMLQPLSDGKSRKSIDPFYKANRQPLNEEFYNSLDLIRYYFLTGNTRYHTARIPNLEADDLVKPCIDLYKDKSILLVTNDSDWCKYLLPGQIDYLPDLYGSSVSYTDFSLAKGYAPTEDTIILDKIMNGDSADNIKAVFPEFSKELRTDIVLKFGSVLEFLFRYHEDDKLKDFAPLIKEREQHIRLAYQMLAAISVTDKHFKAIFTTGRNSDTIQQNLRTVIFDVVEKEEDFEFGGLKVPRTNPGKE